MALRSPSSLVSPFFIYPSGYAMQGFLSRNGAWVLNVGLGAPTRRQPIAKDFATWANDNPTRSIIMSEGVGFNNPKSATTQRQQHKSFVMFRNPQTHVLSQYFHCAESQDHRKRIKKARLMRRTCWNGCNIGKAFDKTRR
jgi:hypothetical protein